MIPIPIPLSHPDITESEIEAVVAVLRSPHLSLGPKMETFEESVATYIGVPYGIAVSSGTAGLHLCLCALGIGPGDEVLVPSFTFIAAANVIRYVGATPIFVDIESETLNLDPVAIEAGITPRTRAIMVVHTFGRAAKMESILAIARRHRLRVIEDACEAIGAEYRGQRTGSFGDAAVFAFYPNKQITTGEGGMIVTRDAALARELRALRNQGRYPSDAWHQHSILGYNYRLSELHCALGIAQMARLDVILARRAEVAQMYDAALRDHPQLILPKYATSDSRTSWFVYVIRIAAGDHGLQRDDVLHALAVDGIQCGRYFAPIHQQPAYRDWPLSQPLPVTEAESRRTLALPFFNSLSHDQIAYIVERLRHALA